ncbi:MAG: GspB domain-containing protein [Gammaproteobacteria bacterium]|nr:GspB domain-containing protein [Gammaproteobacteria bacterium]
MLISQDPAAVPASSLYPTIQEVRAAGSTDIPDLHLDIHVFSPEPEDRFVFINMSKLREGSQLDEGPVVAEITPNGVVLHHDGQHFLLPRE